MTGGRQLVPVIIDLDVYIFKEKWTNLVYPHRSPGDIEIFA